MRKRCGLPHPPSASSASSAAASAGFGAADDAPATAESAAAALAGLRTLLYVEDNLTNLQLVERLSRRNDLRMLSAVDGNQGVDLARSCLPDVILMDINLPGISGIEAVKILRDDALTAHIPVVALSANAMPRDIQRGMEAGFFHYLTKPIRGSDFHEDLGCGSCLRGTEGFYRPLTRPTPGS